ncbi:MAG: helix-turn-helix domain-containing protein [Tannerella sp.]|jgi:transcriptional regulator with XRE-family HTH domain|nr:helix-turn-helix domain-containing protein [Tannerella sp.]
MANLLIIRDLVERKGITIRDLAGKVGMSDISIHKMIKNGSTSISTLERIAKVLDVPVSVFFDEDASNENHITQKGGNSNAASIYGDSLSGNIESKNKEIEYLKKILEDKEDIIRILKKQLCYEEK